MNLKDHFIYNPNLDLTASNIGINKWDWQAISCLDENTAKGIMKENRFDVLPIINKDKSITHYFSTRNYNNYENLNLTSIREEDKIYYRTSFCDLVRKFSTENTRFYFLSDYKEIVGLISFVNLNSQAVYNYLFQVLADIERSASCFLKTLITSDQLISLFEKTDNPKILELVCTYKKNIIAGDDNSIFESMYLQTIAIAIQMIEEKIIGKSRKLIPFLHKFAANNTYGELRNKVMHPVRPILNDKNSIKKINELLEDYSELKKIFLAANSGP